MNVGECLVAEIEKGSCLKLERNVSKSSKKIVYVDLVQMRTELVVALSTPRNVLSLLMFLRGEDDYQHHIDWLLITIRCP